MSAADDLPPISRDVAGLLAEERIVPPVDEARRGRVLASVDAALLVPLATRGPAHGPASPPVARSWAGYALAMAIGLGIGAAIGAWIHAALTRPTPPDRPYVEHVEPARAPVRESSPLPAPQSAPDEPLPPTPAPPLARAAAPAPRSRPPELETTGLAGENRIVDAARSAIVRGHPAEALRAIVRHEQLFPDGSLTEEREVLAVQALVALGETAQASARAERFRAAHPTSLSTGVIDRALQATPAEED